MRRFCQPPDGREPEERDFGSQSFADCVLIVERRLADVQRHPHNKENWRLLRFSIQSAAVKYVDSFRIMGPAPVNPKDLHMLRSAVAQAIETLPTDADPKLRNWLETAPQSMINSDTAAELEVNLRKSLEDVFGE